MSNFAKHKIDPIELIKGYWPQANIGHITYDPNMTMNKRQYWVIRNTTHDGTVLFTIEMIKEALLPLVNKTTCFKLNIPEDTSKITDIKYTIGPAWRSCVFGRVKLGCGVCLGMKERIRIPVICEYVFMGEVSIDG